VASLNLFEQSNSENFYLSISGVLASTDAVAWCIMPNYWNFWRAKNGSASLQWADWARWNQNQWRYLLFACARTGWLFAFLHCLNELCKSALTLLKPKRASFTFSQQISVTVSCMYWYHSYRLFRRSTLRPKAIPEYLYESLTHEYWFILLQWCKSQFVVNCDGIIADFP